MPYDNSVTSFAKGAVEVQDLKEYFRRPRLVGTGSFSTTTSSLWSAQINRALLFSTWFPGGLVRLEGVAGVRFDVVLTVTAAANPFHCGVATLSYQHDGVQTDTDVFCRTNFGPATTMIPHVRLDLSEQTMVSLTAPWFYPQDYLTLDSTVSDWNASAALVQIIPTPSLVSSGPATFKVFVHLENLELIGSSPVTEQFITAQSGLRANKPATGVAAPTQEKKYGGLISTTLNAASDVTTALTRFVPSIAAIGGPTAWGLRWAARVASAFGYSKPRDEQPPKRMFRTDYIGDSNVDMPSEAFALAATAANTLRVDQTFSGTDEDQMSLAYVLGKYSQICLFQMTTSDTVGTRLWGTLTCPLHYWYRAGTTTPFCNLAPPYYSNTYNAFYPSGLMYFSTFFRMWRGGVKFRFTFGKCKFHAGRVMVGFVPFPKQYQRLGRNTDTIPAVEVSATLPQPFSYTKVFDLRDGNVFEFEVPYLSPHLWTGCNSHTGGVTMTVLDPLIANGECSTSIRVLAEVAAMEDFEFAVPTPPTVCAVQDNNNVLVYTQSGLAPHGTMVPPQEPEPVPPPDPEPQSGLGVVNDREVAEYTTGETIRSLKQLMMIPSSAVFTVLATDYARTCLPNFTYLPRFTNAVPMANNTRAYFANNRAGLIAACYNYFNGGTAYDVYVNTNGTTVTQIYQAPLDSNVSSAQQFAVSVYGQGSQNNALKVSTNYNSLHVVAPLYSYYARPSIRSQYYTTSNFRTFAPGTSNMAYPGNTFALSVLGVRGAGADSYVTLNMSAADDARVSYYMGPPLVHLFNPLQIVSPDSSYEAIS